MYWLYRFWRNLTKRIYYNPETMMTDGKVYWATPPKGVKLAVKKEKIPVIISL